MIIIVGAAGADINITNIEERFCDNWDFEQESEPFMA